MSRMILNSSMLEMLMGIMAVQYLRRHLQGEMKSVLEQDQATDPQASAKSSEQASADSVPGAGVNCQKDGPLPAGCSKCKECGIIIIVQEGGILNLSDIHDNEQVRQMLKGRKEDES